MFQYEVHAYGKDACLRVPVVTYERLKSDAAAKAKAGRLAKSMGGPVDLARSGSADWSERYLTTAAPSDFHVSGYRFERLD
jgi:hypothetical protein